MKRIIFSTIFAMTIISFFVVFAGKTKSKSNSTTTTIGFNVTLVGEDLEPGIEPEVVNLYHVNLNDNTQTVYPSFDYDYISSEEGSNPGEVDIEFEVEIEDLLDGGFIALELDGFCAPILISYNELYQEWPGEVTDTVAVGECKSEPIPSNHTWPVGTGTSITSVSWDKPAHSWQWALQKSRAVWSLLYYLTWLPEGSHTPPEICNHPCPDKDGKKQTCYATGIKIDKGGDATWETYGQDHPAAGMVYYEVTKKDDNNGHKLEGLIICGCYQSEEEADD